MPLDIPTKFVMQHLLPFFFFFFLPPTDFGSISYVLCFLISIASPLRLFYYCEGSPKLQFWLFHVTYMFLYLLLRVTDEPPNNILQ